MDRGVASWIGAWRSLIRGYRPRRGLQTRGPAAAEQWPRGASGFVGLVSSGGFVCLASGGFVGRGSGGPGQVHHGAGERSVAIEQDHHAVLENLDRFLIGRVRGPIGSGDPELHFQIA